MLRPTSRTAEMVGFALGTLLSLSAFAALRLHSPEWLVNAAIGAAFVIAIPTMLPNLRRRWRGD